MDKVNKERVFIKTIEIDKASSNSEIFQNTVLRQILKEKNELILAVFIQYLSSNKVVFNVLTKNLKIELVRNRILKDNNLKNVLIGMIIGQFELNEFLQFSNEITENRKRITELIITRIQSQIEKLTQ